MSGNGDIVIDLDSHIVERGIIETGGGWLPLALDRRYALHHVARPRAASQAAAARSAGFWRFATDWPHGDSAWPDSVQQIAERPGLTASARKKLFGENASASAPGSERSPGARRRNTR